MNPTVINPTFKKSIVVINLDTETSDLSDNVTFIYFA